LRSARAVTWPYAWYSPSPDEPLPTLRITGALDVRPGAHVLARLPCFTPRVMWVTVPAKAARTSTFLPPVPMSMPRWRPGLKDCVKYPATGETIRDGADTVARSLLSRSLMLLMRSSQVTPWLPDRKRDGQFLLDQQLCCTTSSIVR